MILSLAFHRFRRVVSPALLILSLTLVPLAGQAAGTWSTLTSQAPGGVALMLLLPNGNVMCQNSGNVGWYLLTPSTNGSYVKGTWTTLSSMTYSRRYYSSQVLESGNVLVAGGEYGTGGPYSEIYNPGNNLWTVTPNAPGVENFIDSISETLPNGNVMISPVTPSSFGATVIWNVASNSWETGPTLYRGDDQDEAAWVKLADQSILTIDPYGTNSERYIPSLNQWINDANVPTVMYGYGGELGAGFLLPNGKAFFIGGTNHTAIYTPSGTTNMGSWAAGATIPNNLAAVDAPAAMMMNGNVLCGIGSDLGYLAPTYFYEYNYVSNKFSQVSAPGGGLTNSAVPYGCTFLDLPDGTVLFSNGGTQLYSYQPSGTPVTNGVPTITSVTTNANGSFHISGKLLNGISEGAAYGDDEQMYSDYPIARITNSAGHTVYCQTFNWSIYTPMTGTNIVTTEMMLPAGLAAGTYSLVVSANGISSAPYRLSTAATPATLTLTYTAGTNGILTGTSPQTLAYGQTGTAITAVPAVGYTFTGWSDGSTANPRMDIRVTTNVTVTANFASVGSGFAQTYEFADSAGDAMNIPNMAVPDTGVTQTAYSGANQQWTVLQVSGSEYKILAADGLALTASNVNSQLFLQPYTGTNSQLWTFTTTNNGAFYNVVNVGSGQNIDDWGGGAGTIVGEYVASPGDANQNWTLTAVTPSGMVPGTYEFLSAAGYALDDPNGATGAGTDQTNYSGAHQQWTLVPFSGSEYWIEAANGQAVTAGGANSQLSLAAFSAASSQLWTLTINSNRSSYTIVNVGSGENIDDWGGGAGTIVGQYVASPGDVNQNWTLTAVAPAAVFPGTYEFGDSGGYALNVPNGAGPNTGVNQTNYSGANQQWTVTLISSNEYQILAANGLALTASNLDSQLYLQPYTGASSQLWSFGTTNNGASYTVLNEGSSEVMDDNAGGGAGVAVLQYSASPGDASQQWVLTSVTPVGMVPGTYQFLDYADYYLNDPNGAKGVGVTQTNYSGTNQQWTITLVSGNEYWIAAANGQALTASNADSQLYVLPYTGGSGQLWTFSTVNNRGYYYIVNVGTGENIDDWGGGSGELVGQYSAVDDANQEWTLTAVTGAPVAVNFVTARQPAIQNGTLGYQAGTFSMSFSGQSGQGYTVLTSTNLSLPLSQWQVQTTGTFPDGPVNFSDSAATNAQKFYQVTSP